MDFAPVYLVNRFFYRLFDFFRHWYLGASRSIAHGFVSFLEGVDRSIALRITLVHFFEPLYKDYTIVGRILGVVFRSGRIIIGIAVYLILSALFLAIYAAWILLPPLVIFYAVRDF